MIGLNRTFWLGVDTKFLTFVLVVTLLSSIINYIQNNIQQQTIIKIEKYIISKKDFYIALKDNDYIYYVLTNKATLAIYPKNYDVSNEKMYSEAHTKIPFNKETKEKICTYFKNNQDKYGKPLFMSNDKYYQNIKKTYCDKIKNSINKKAH